MKKKNLLKKRGAGILMAVSSLPSPYGIGTLGQAALDFIDDLKAAGQTYWQVLPIGPTSFGDSPYQSLSAFAGNPYFIDLDILKEQRLLTQEDIDSFSYGDDPANVDYAALYASRFRILRKAYENARLEYDNEYSLFLEENKYWLDDYALFMACKTHFGGQEWLKWPEDIRFRKKGSVEKYSRLLKDDIRFHKFCQYKFYEQFRRVKAYAGKNNIYIIGDIPLYVALDSADVWSRPELFDLDSERRPRHVAGVPPDMFSATGQLWGNPIYNWKKMEKQDFSWWRRRMENIAACYDVIRIDHFIGIVNYWSIPAGDDTAENGEWVKGPGKKLTRVIEDATGSSKLIAEDLGVITEPVRKLINETGWPGMKVLQFAFGDTSENEYLPHNYNKKNVVVYGGTHDNDTLYGFLDSIDEKQFKFVRKYLGVKKNEDKQELYREMSEEFIRVAYMSIGNTVIFQMQDLLGLGNTARMNVPSTTGGNWRFRTTHKRIPGHVIKMLKKYTKLYNR